MRKPNAILLENELSFVTSRSGGPGGQNVNKVNSKVTLVFDVRGSQVLTPEEKDMIFQRLSTHLTQEGVLMVKAQDSRSQRENREIAVEKFDALLAKAFEKKKTRRATKPTKAARQQRLNKKKVVSEKKKWRRRPDV
jgi:ribosome-associated protein